MVFATSYLVSNEYTEFTQPRQLFLAKKPRLSQSWLPFYLLILRVTRFPP